MMSVEKTVTMSFTKKEIISILPFTVASKKIKYLGSNITEEMKELYSKNFKSLKKKNRGKC